MTVPHTAATTIATGAAPLRFFLLVLLLSVPFYILGATGFRLPGLTILPASALMTFMPMIAALILVQRERGAAAAIAMFKRALRPSPDHRIRWPLTALVFMPVVCLLEFGVLRLTGSAVPLPQIAPGAALLLFTGFMIGAIGEEVGWQGYAYPALRTRLSVLALSLGLNAHLVLKTRNTKKRQRRAQLSFEANAYRELIAGDPKSLDPRASGCIGENTGPFESSPRVALFPPADQTQSANPRQRRAQSALAAFS